MRVILACLAALSVASCASQHENAAPTPTPAAQRIDALLAPRIPTREANGVVLVFQDGVEIYRREIGMADFEHHRPITRDTVFRIASLTKTFTAAAAMSLRAEQRLDFRAPISTYLPDYPRGGDIRVFHLLTHAAGLGDVPEPPNGGRYETLDAAIASFSAQPLAFEPGSRSQYSNAGYVLSAKLIEVASGQRFDDVLRTRFFEPLHMTSAIDNPLPGSVRNVARLYYPAPTADGVVPVEGSDLTSIVGAGSLLMNADDLMRWLESIRSHQLVDVWSAEFPFGWGRRDYFGGAIEQTGRNRGFGASATIVPGRNLSALCLFNTQSGFALACSTAVAAAVLNEPPPNATLPLDFERVPFDRDAAAALAGVYQSPQGWKLALQLQDGGLYYAFYFDAPDRWIPVSPAAGGRYLLLGDLAMLTVDAAAGARPAHLRYQAGGDDLTLERLN